MQVKDVLVEARDVIVDRGWVQKDYSDDTGFCTVGAVGYVISTRFVDGTLTDDETTTLFSEAQDALRKALEAGGRITNIVAWNDAGHRTVEDVLELFDEAARVAGE